MPRPSREEIEAAVEKAGSIRKAAPILGVDERTVRRWIGASEEDVPVVERTNMRLLAIDIETRPHLSYHWDLWNQNIHIAAVKEFGGMISWGAKWINEGGEVAFRSDFHDGHEAMVRGIWLMMNTADAVVHYNGAKFDVPHIQREFAVLGLPLPSPFKQIDLIKTAKRQFRFASNKLAHVAPQLGLEDKEKHEGFGLWLACLEGDEGAWERMRSYNIQDVELVEQLYNRLLPYILGHPSHAAFHGRDICPQCGSEDLKPARLAYLKTGQYPRYECGSCGSYSRDTRRSGATRITSVV